MIWLCLSLLPNLHVLHELLLFSTIPYHIDKSYLLEVCLILIIQLKRVLHFHTLRNPPLGSFYSIIPYWSVSIKNILSKVYLIIILEFSNFLLFVFCSKKFYGQVFISLIFPMKTYSIRPSELSLFSVTLTFLLSLKVITTFILIPPMFSKNIHSSCIL